MRKVLSVDVEAETVNAEVEAVFAFQKGDPKEIGKKIEASKAKRKASQPLLAILADYHLDAGVGQRMLSQCGERPAIPLDDRRQELVDDDRRVGRQRIARFRDAQVVPPDFTGPVTPFVGEQAGFERQQAQGVAGGMTALWRTMPGS